MKTSLAKAVVAAGLLCTWDQPPANAELYSFVGSITPEQTLSDVYFVFDTGACNSVVYTHKIADSMTGGVTTSFSFQMEMDEGARERSTHEPYGEFQTIFAIYNDATDGVTIGYNTTAATKILAETIAPEWIGPDLPVYSSDSDTVGVNNVGNTESEIAAMLRTDTLAINGVRMFFDYPILDPPRFANRPSDSNFTLLNFSGATLGGVATLYEGSAVPEPSSLALLVMAGLIVAWDRRRRG